MFQILTRFFKALALSILLALGILSLTPNVVLADTSVSLDSSNDVVNVATVYDTDSSTQADVLSNALKSAESTLPQASGFLDSSVLKSQDGTNVVILTQWQDLSSFQAYEAKHPQIVVKNVEPRTYAFEVKKIETRNDSPSIHEHENVMFSEFRMKPGQDQSELANIVSQEMPGVMQMIPGLQWAAMCPSTDQTTIALIAKWNSREEFESLGTNPGFDKQTAYWQSYADNDHDIYDVVEIIHS